MRSLDVIANVTASNAKVYAGQGHPRSIYIPNTWTDQRPPVPVQQLPIPWPAQHGGPINIIGHVGFLDRTGTTYGLHYLLNQVMPELEPALRGLDYRVHVIGGGQPAPALQAKLAHPRVVVHGYVQDLDAMLWASDAFLFLNNAGPLRAAFTRHVIAWSMGLCLIVHANSRLAIPEIRHMENALAGATPAELAQLVRLAVTDRALNARLRTAGRATYEKRFTPAAVAQELSREAEQLVAQRRATQPASAGARR
jgi:glycosyltransferase involved in cell wall biosynthesis